MVSVRTLRNPWQWLSQLYFGDVIAFFVTILTILAVSLLGIVTAARLIGWDDFSNYEEGLKLAAKNWPIIAMIVAASLLVFFKPAAWIRQMVRRRASVEAHSSNLEAAIEEMYKQRRSKKPEWKRSREQLLLAAEAQVSAVLNESHRDSVKANLVLLAPEGKIRVEARSKLGSPIGDDAVYPPEPHWPVMQSLETNRTVAYNLKKNEGLNGHEKRPYKSIVSTPITNGTKGYGAITIDSPDRGCFNGLEDNIDQILRPYAQLVRLTIEDDAVSVNCPNRYDR